MPRKLLLISLLLTCIQSTFGQTEFKGKVLDKKSNKSLSNVNLFIPGLKIGTTTNDDGIFIFKDINQGEHLLKISCVGYRDTSFQINISNIKTIPNHIYLSPYIQKISEIIVTADRQPKKIDDIPARIDIVSPGEVKSYPATNVDNYLQAVPNVYVNRSWGIFSKNSSVTMRGMDGTSRVLVLLDGVPLNKTAGGGINWHLIESGQVDKIEVLKGPASALYGNNAMGGVINIITKKNQERLSGEATVFGGTYNTFGGKVNIANNFIIDNRGFYWSGNAFYRQGNGYIIVPENERDSTDTKLGIHEYSVNLSTGYQFNKKHKLDFSAQLYDDKRDEGIKIYENYGSYLKYTTRHFRGSYEGNINGFAIYANSFYHRQDYYQRSERLNSTGDNYKLYDRNQRTEDYGIWLNVVKKVLRNNELSFGADYKHGNFWAEDIYFTSTDYFERGGNIDFYALFFQNDSKLMQDKLIFSLGLRADIAQFKNGYLNVEDPTSVTAFDSQLEESFHETNWNQISPKIALRYKFNSYLQSYVSFSTGFMPPKLDDMVSSRKISNGFKIANPYLQPETLTNYEIGFDLFPSEKLKFDISVYYAIGNDFQYFVGTGDTVDIDRPVVKRENISKVDIYGLETAITWKPVSSLTLKANYTHNHSQISEFNLSGYTGNDLTGKLISETPPHQAYLGLFFTNKILDINLVTNYISKMWQDELNTIELESYTTIDLRLQKKIKHINLVLDIQNILDNRFVDKKGGLSPGRYIIGEISYKF